MKKTLTHISIGLLAMLITLSCGGTTGYYLLSTPAISKQTEAPLTPHSENDDTPAGLSSDTLALDRMPYPTVGDVADLTSMGGVIYSYNTNADFQRTIFFYKAELPKQGYSLFLEDMKEGVAVLEFKNTNNTVNITISLNVDTQVVNVVIIES